MKLVEVVQRLSLAVRASEDRLDVEVSGGYASDLLSDVMAHSSKGDVWVTLQIHQNIVAVAMLKELSGIIIINGREPEEATIEKAKDEKIPLLTSELPAFEIVGKLYQLGISGMR